MHLSKCNKSSDKINITRKEKTFFLRFRFLWLSMDASFTSIPNISLIYLSIWKFHCMDPILNIVDVYNTRSFRYKLSHSIHFLVQSTTMFDEKQIFCRIAQSCFCLFGNTISQEKFDRKKKESTIYEETTFFGQSIN